MLLGSKAWAFGVDLACEIPQPPTVVVSFPGFLIGCGRGTTDVVIFNATGVSRVAFTIADKNLPPLDLFSLSAQDGAPYTLEEIPSGDSSRYIVSATSATFGVGRLTLDWIIRGCPCSYNECILDPMPIRITSVDAWNAANEGLVIAAIDGGFHPVTDVGVDALWGRVYYSDGATRTYSGFVHVHAIDGIRLDQRWNAFSVSYYDGQYSVGNYHGAGIGQTPPPRVVLARACLTEDCATCTEYEEIPWGGPGHPAHHDFILPVDAPTATATPTPTETSTPIPSPTPTFTGTPTYATDINGDSKVDAEDLLILLNDWKKVSGP
jgi:hypothetical protein